MRAAIRSRANRIFVDHPEIGRLGYSFLRASGLDRSTRGVKRYFQSLAGRGFTPGVVLDIGANHGGWSQSVRDVYHSADFFLIEPQQEMAPFLDRFVAGSPGSRWFLGGAGAKPGESLITLWDDFQGSAFLTREIQSMVPFSSQRSVPILTVDELITSEQMPIPDLVKIDVQGYELEVLQGSRMCIGKSDLFVIETSFHDPLGRRPNYYRVVEFMEAYGYTIYDFLDLKYRPTDGALWQADICFVRRGSLLAAKK